MKDNLENSNIFSTLLCISIPQIKNDYHIYNSVSFLHLQFRDVMLICGFCVLKIIFECNKDFNILLLITRSLHHVKDIIDK